MAIITINTTPISEFITKFFSGISNTEWAIMVGGIWLFVFITLYQQIREDEKRKIKRIKESKKRYYD